MFNMESKSKTPGKLDLKSLQNRFDQGLNPKNKSPPVTSSKKLDFGKEKVPMFVSDRGSIKPPKGSNSKGLESNRQNQFPKAKKTEFPETKRPEFTKATRPETPQMTKPDFTKAAKPVFPKKAGPAFPKAANPEFPKTTQPEFPNTTKPEVSHTKPPAVINPKPKTNIIPPAFSNELASKLAPKSKNLEEQTTLQDTSVKKGWAVPSTKTMPRPPPTSDSTNDTHHGSIERADSIPQDQAPSPPQDISGPPVLFYKGRRLPDKVKINGTTYRLTPLPLDTGALTPKKPLRQPHVVPIVPDDADADEMYIPSSTKHSIAPDSSDEDEGFGYQGSSQGIGYITDENYDDCVDPNSVQYQHGQYPVHDENYDDCVVDEEAVYEEL